MLKFKYKKWRPKRIFTATQWPSRVLQPPNPKLELDRYLPAVKVFTEENICCSVLNYGVLGAL